MPPLLVIDDPSSKTRNVRFSQLESFVVPEGICCSASQAVTRSPPVVLVVLVVLVLLVLLVVELEVLVVVVVLVVDVVVVVVDVVVVVVLVLVDDVVVVELVLVVDVVVDIAPVKTSMRSPANICLRVSVIDRPAQSMVSLWSTPRIVHASVCPPILRSTVLFPVPIQKVRNTSSPSTRSKGTKSLFTVTPDVTVAPLSQSPPNVILASDPSTPFSVWPSRFTSDTRWIV